ncbi:MAG: STT3 domain-containing protein [Nanoarchaeota archaeon]|nr:STT3 domain-containing protein [Nanoarchaeota archaeon]
MNEEHQKKDEEVIDFSKIKEVMVRFFKKKQPNQQIHTPEVLSSGAPSSPATYTHGQQRQKKVDDIISVDCSQIKAFAKNHAKWLVPLFCILLAMSVSIYLRTMPLRMPIADDWAENTVTNFYKNQLQSQISEQYPNLPPQNREILVQKEWEKTQQENKEVLDEQISQLANQYRNNFRDDQGTTYLLGIDPYYYYRQTEYVLNNGFPGTRIKDGKVWDDYRLAPLGREGEWNFHHWFGALWHRFLNLFGTFPLMFTFFFVGTIFSALTVLPGFFIGRRLTNNNAGGFFVAMLLAVSAFFVSRTTGESSDTDVYSVFFPVLIAWLFLEALYAKEKKWKWIWMSLAGFSTGVFAFAWTGWWYIATFISITALLGVLLDFVIVGKKKNPEQKKSYASLSLLGLYALTTSFFVSIFTSATQFSRVILGPFQFLRLKAVAVTSYWPNIRTTVAELNVAPLSRVIEQLDGKLLFFLAIVGIVLLALKKNEAGKRTPLNFLIPFFLAMWLIASLYATTKGVRFILQVTPVFAIALGSGLGLVWNYTSRWVSKELKLNRLATGVILFLLLSIVLIQPVKSGYSQAFNSLPSVNDVWYNALTKIKNEAPENVIITSWWDFGHWFKAIANRPVTFDGGTQTSWGAYWVGKSLLTPDEKLTVGIVRMLNCGQNTAFEELDTILNDTPKSIAILNAIVPIDKEKALQILREEGLTAEQTETVLQYTHCDNPPEDIYITSEDMVGKAGVWGHFGSWDFRKAVMHKETRNLDREEAIGHLTSRFNLSPENAAQIYAEIISTDADKWISPWPGYLNGPQECERIAEQEIRCVASVQGGSVAARISLENFNVTLEGNPGMVPDSLVYPTSRGIVEKELDGKKMGVSLILIPNRGEYMFILAHPLQVASMFTKLFYFEGQGLKCFSTFDRIDQGGFKIITWRVDYACQQENN